MKHIVRIIRNNADLYRVALYLGLTGYGGLAALGQIKRAYVTRSKIISEQVFQDALSLSRVVPGSTIITLIAFFSYLRAGLIGAILSTTIYILPTFLLTTAFAALYFHYSSLVFMAPLLRGLNILLVPLLIHTLIGVGMPVLFQSGTMAKRSTLIALGCFALFVGFSVGMIPITVIAGLCGAVLYAPTYFFTKRQEDLRAVNTLVFRRKKAWFLLMAAIVLFSLIIYGTSMPLWTLFSSFFRIGMLAFGGGIAAIPLIEASFVRALHWFTPMQFWDGIAISQITPGPIFIVAAFFGYKIYGILGAAVATIGMCIPSVLLMIMVGKVHALIKHLTIVQGITKGLLSGFIGVLAALIIQQIERIVPSWETAILIGVSFIIIRSVKRGAFLAAVLCIVFSFFLPAH